MHIIQQSKIKHKLPIQWISTFPAIAFAVACYVGYMFSNPLYNSSDNVDVAMVVNGYYEDLGTRYHEGKVSGI